MVSSKTYLVMIIKLSSVHFFQVDGSSRTTDVASIHSTKQPVLGSSDYRSVLSAADHYGAKYGHREFEDVEH